MNKKSSLFILGLIALFFSCQEKNQTKTENPRYSDEVEQRIARVINNLQVGTPINDEYRTDSFQPNELFPYTRHQCCGN